MMARSIHIEAIQQKDRYLHSELLSKDELEEAMNLCVKQVEANLDYFKEKFPWGNNSQRQQHSIMTINRWKISNGPMVFGQECCGCVTNIQKMRNIVTWL